MPSPTRLQHANAPKKVSPARILVVEDHKRLLQSLTRGLTKAGYDVVAADSGEAGFYCASTVSIDAVILDVMLPGRSGLEILRELRQTGFSAPVIVLSARSTVADRVHGLEQGADDYLVKPFAFEELLARIHAHLKRAAPGRPIVLKAADLELDASTRSVVRAGIAVDLSRLECRLLEYLMHRTNEIVTRRAIERDVWGRPRGIATNVIDVCVNALRRKLERPDLPKLIRTIRGAGYALVDGSAPLKEPPPDKDSRDAT